MAFPWLAVVDTVLGLTDVALKRRSGRQLSADPHLERLPVGGEALGPVETRLVGVVVAALREAFDRDHQRLELERQQMDVERQRAERALRLELRRQAGDREIGRLRLVAGVAVASWLGTALFATRIIGGAAPARVALGAGWLLLLGSLAAAFAGQSRVATSLADGDDRVGSAPPSPGTAGAIAPWLIVAGLAFIATGVLFT